MHIDESCTVRPEIFNIISLLSFLIKQNFSLQTTKTECLAHQMDSWIAPFAEGFTNTRPHFSSFDQ